MNDLIDQNGGVVMESPSSRILDGIAEGRAMQQMRTNYATAVAVQRPRNLNDLERRLKAEARLGGEDFYYGWRAGGEVIEGPSIELALAAARCWGNCAVAPEPVQDLGDSWIFTAAFVDLETGFTLSRQFRQSKSWKVHGKHDEERKSDIRFQIGQSKAIRNVILNAIPKSLIKIAMGEAKAGVKARIEGLVERNGLPAAVDAAVRALGKAGVPEASILARWDLASRNGLGIDQLVILRGDLTAIENGQERPENLFPAVQPKPDLASQLQEKAADAEKQARAATLAAGIEAIKESQRAVGEQMRETMNRLSPAEDPKPTAVVQTEPRPERKVSKASIARIKAAMTSLTWSDADADDFLALWSAKRIEDLTQPQADEAIAKLQEAIEAQKARDAAEGAE